METDAPTELVRHPKVRMGSNRNFGMVFAGVCALLAALAAWRGQERAWAWAAAAVAFFIVALVAPKLLGPFNTAWFRLGLVLNRVVSPIVMGAAFFVALTPMALVLRAFGKDPLHLRWDRLAATYWIRRDPPGPLPESMRDQF